MTFTTVDGLDYTLNAISRGEEPVPSYYVALLYSQPGITVAGEELDEPVGYLGYSRGVLANESANWHTMHGQLTNVPPIDFPIAGEDWGVIRYWAICDSAEGGRVFWVGDFSDPVDVSEGDQLQIPGFGLSMYFAEDDT